jgi:type II secretory pathway pseudopilin PulG
MVELLIVIAIMATLIALLAPGVQKLRRAAATNATMDKLKEMSLATHSCQDRHKKLPPAYGPFDKVTATVHVHLLPFLEQDELHKKWINAPGPIKGNVIPPFLAPMDFTQTRDGADGQNFLANLRVFADAGSNLEADGLTKGITWPTPAEAKDLGWPNPYWGTAKIPVTFPDGTSNTILFTTGYMNCPNETSQRLYFNSPELPANSFFGVVKMTAPASSDGTGATGTIFQMQPFQRDCDPAIPQSIIESRIWIGMADASVRVVHTEVETLTWARIVQPNDGRMVVRDWW